MLVDAIRAEGFRLSKNRTALFWSVLFVPIIAVAIGALTNLVLKGGETKLLVDGEAPPELTQMMTSSPLDLGEAVVSAAGDLANPLILLFVLIGAATIYAGDYRWETWRLISARNSRTNLLLGKLAVVAVMSLVAMLLMLVAGLIENLIKAAVFERQLTFSMTGAMAGQFIGQLALSWARILQFTMMGMLAAVVTRSLLAALFVPLVVGVAQFFSPNLLMTMGLTPDAWLAMLINPGAAVDAISAAIAGAERAAALPDGIVLKAWASLGLWILLPLAGALAWFKRQDLSKE
ncbi:MAG: ABC transporter permease subunit [Brevundimonas sp.]|uniref:ABC transporter permease subunit n=1 Tax=Brevundimonas sp. TaxID=1871086 RepID=UPI0026351D62|nr:ABC transporter permease subunit [Brevundimonas sp.]MDI6623852.1 ABC transporter permease subunit [Brevundimonas sp.]MDQ7812702.1 ABC transporter permease subunit [Brevundimonas sp.]